MEFALFEKRKNTARDTIDFIQKLDNVLRISPHCTKALQLKGFLLIAGSNYAEAKNIFFKAFKANSFSPYTLFYLSMLYNFSGQNDSASYLINQAIGIKNPNGYVLDRNNLFSEELDINYDELIHYRGVISFEQNRLKEAKQDFLFCINRKYNSPDIFGYLAFIYSHENKIDSACWFHKMAIESGDATVFDTTLYRKCK